LPPKNTGQWLNEHAILEGDFLRQNKHPSVHIDPWDTDIFGEASWVEIGTPQSVTNRVVTVQTVMAGITGDVMRDEDSITDVITIHTIPNLYDLSCDLMAEHPGRLFDAVPLHDITPADATGHHLNQ
jgi:hypothetical protein